MKSKSILHICNDFLGSTVYKELYKNLDSNGVIQTIFSPVRRHNKQNVFRIPFKTDASSIVYSEVIKSYHRFFFNAKITYLYNSLIRQVGITGVGLSHATTFFSDGAIAYRLFKKFNIPYVVAVRSTDVDIFLKLRPDLFPLAAKIIKNSARIIFISKAIEKKFLAHYFLRRYHSLIVSKSEVIYNGVGNLWLENIRPKQQLKPNKVLYVGTFIKRKRLKELIVVVSQLRSTFPDISLCVVGGGGGRMEKEILQLIEQNGDFIEYKGIIKDIDSLIRVFRENHVFAMPSYNETFGLVYVEALSQGLPILMGKGEAIDGVLENIGEMVNPHSIKSIKEGLLNIFNNYPKYQIKPDDLQMFNWSHISKTYINIYNSFSQQPSADER